MLGDAHAGGIRTAACGSDDYGGANAPVPSPARSESRIRVIHAVDAIGNRHPDERRARPFLRANSGVPELGRPGSRDTAQSRQPARSRTPGSVSGQGSGRTRRQTATATDAPAAWAGRSCAPAPPSPPPAGRRRRRPSRRGARSSRRAAPKPAARPPYAPLPPAPLVQQPCRPALLAREPRTAPQPCVARWAGRFPRRRASPGPGLQRLPDRRFLEVSDGGTRAPRVAARTGPRSRPSLPARPRAARSVVVRRSTRR
ncbi:hypothetical protein SAMN05216533_8138 [Streptomyces sp. Ag109_O5-10]|nr:hypothetical protein SAMN05216533_8138 [Streptomyces sp. Ag109_O5-10]